VHGLISNFPDATQLASKSKKHHYSTHVGKPDLPQAMHMLLGIIFCRGMAGPVVDLSKRVVQKAGALETLAFPEGTEFHVGLLLLCSMKSSDYRHSHPFFSVGRHAVPAGTASLQQGIGRNPASCKGSTDSVSGTILGKDAI
jgi:hypothetical protein